MIKRSQLPPEKVGIAIGAAIGIAFLTVIAFRAEWVAHLLSFSILFGLKPAVAVLLLVAVAATVGATIGAQLAKVGLVPSFPIVTTLAFAILVAVGPTLAGFAEVWIRGVPFPMPANVTITEWHRHPWGDQLLSF